MIAWLLNPSVDLEHARSRLDDDDVDRRALLDNAMDSLDPFASTDTVMLSADVTGNDREQILEEFESGDRDILISTILKEGVDIPDISSIVLAHGQKSDLETIQTIGRALRPTGNHARIVDVADRGEYFRSAFRERLNTMTRYYELDLELSEDTVPIPAVPDDELSVAPIDRGALAQTDSETPGQKTLTDLP
jgi:superfamily II DNA/RNA helicase